MGATMAHCRLMELEKSPYHILFCEHAAEIGGGIAVLCLLTAASVAISKTKSPTCRQRGRQRLREPSGGTRACAANETASG